MKLLKISRLYSERMRFGDRVIYSTICRMATAYARNHKKSPTGFRVRVQTLAKALQLDRKTVRAALARLAAVGLLGEQRQLVEPPSDLLYPIPNSPSPYWTDNKQYWSLEEELPDHATAAVLAVLRTMEEKTITRGLLATVLGLKLTMIGKCLANLRASGHIETHWVRGEGGIVGLQVHRTKPQAPKLSEKKLRKWVRIATRNLSGGLPFDYELEKLSADELGAVRGRMFPHELPPSVPQPQRGNATAAYLYNKTPEIPHLLTPENGHPDAGNSPPPLPTPPVNNPTPNPPENPSAGGVRNSPTPPPPEAPSPTPSESEPPPEFDPAMFATVGADPDSVLAEFDILDK